jgi:hypothetical protein
VGFVGVAGIGVHLVFLHEREKRSDCCVTDGVGLVCRRNVRRDKQILKAFPDRVRARVRFAVVSAPQRVSATPTCCCSFGETVVAKGAQALVLYRSQYGPS